MMKVLRALFSALPVSVQAEIQRWRFKGEIVTGAFRSDEPEFQRLAELVHPGDIAIDVGANIGHYAVAMSRLVGALGRVIAFEPIPYTFSVLASNVQSLKPANVTLINAAASNEFGFTFMDVPTFRNGTLNYYRASVGQMNGLRVICLPLDAFDLPRIALIKIDVEGHELAVLEGGRSLIERDHPTLIVECTAGGEAEVWLSERGYQLSRERGSPNVLCQYSTTERRAA